MIRFTTGNLLEAHADALVNTVNCVGVMGRGVALHFKDRWPANFKAYAAACKRDEVQPGRMFVFETGRLQPPRFIINFPTKRHWRAKSRLEDVEAGLEALVAEIRRLDIRSIALPPLGAGLGGLDWSVVRPLIERALGALDEVDVIVYEPSGASPRVPSAERGAVTMTVGRAALVGLVDRYLRGILDPYIRLLEIHKLMYFMQIAGEPLRLTVVKGTYGPYAENLRHVMAAVEGHYLTGYGDGGDEPMKLIELVEGAVEQANAVLKSKPDTLARFERVGRLVDGFETSFGLELLSTVHWVCTREGAQTLDEIERLTHEWGKRKQQFTRDQLTLAHRVLVEQRWLDDAPPCKERDVLSTA